MHDCSRPLGIASGWPLADHFLSSFKDISSLHMRVSPLPSRPINQTCSEHTHSPYPPSTAFLPPLPVLPPPVPPSPAPAAGHVPRAQRPSPPLLARDSDGFGAAPEKGHEASIHIRRS